MNQITSYLTEHSSTAIGYVLTAAALWLVRFAGRWFLAHAEATNDAAVRARRVHLVSLLEDFAEKAVVSVEQAERPLLGGKLDAAGKAQMRDAAVTAMQDMLKGHDAELHDIFGAAGEELNDMLGHYVENAVSSLNRDSKNRDQATPATAPAAAPAAQP